MQIKLPDNTILEFRNTGVSNEPIQVYRLIGNETEPIGQIYQLWDEKEENIHYQAVGNNGALMCVPTGDWLRVEEAVTRYAKIHPHKSALEKVFDSGITVSEYPDRNNELEKIRSDKGRKINSLKLSK